MTLLRVGPPAGATRAATLLLHGRARSPEDILGTAARLALPAMPFVAPAAPGFSWYPKSFLVPRAENEPALGDTLAAVDALVATLEAEGVPRERIAILGFSQGACVLSEYAFQRGGRWGALVAFTGGLVGPPGTTWSDHGGRSLAGTPVFLGGSDEDALVPVHRVRETASVLRAMGADVDCLTYPGSEHIVSDDEIRRARPHLARLLPAS